MVTEELERRWNQALQHVRDVEQRLEEEMHRRHLTPAPVGDDFAALMTLVMLGPLEVLIPFLCTDELGGGPRDHSYVLAAFCVTLAAAYVFHCRRKNKKIEKT